MTSPASTFDPLAPEPGGSIGSKLVPGERTSRLQTGLIVLVTLFLATAVVITINKIAPSLPLVLVGGLGLMGLVALAVGKYEGAVALGFLLSGVVKIEPAPPDGVFAVIIAVALVTGRLRADRVPTPILAVLGLLTALNILSFAAAYSIPVGVRFVAITFYMFVFSVWLAGFADRDSRGRLIVKCWLVIAVISALLGTLALQLPSFPMRLEFIGDGDSRAMALFKDPNVYGPFLIPIAVILLEEMISPHLLKMRMLRGYAILAILIIGLIFSFSRAAWANMLFSTAIMLFILLLRRRDTARLFAVIGGLGIVGMIVMAIVVFSGQADFIGQRAQLQGYDSDRFGAQRAGIEIAQEYPLGVGPGNWQFHHGIETHSTYVRVLAEQGVVALAAWLALCLMTLGLAIGNALAGRRSGGIGSAALLGAWCGLMFNGAVVDTLHWRHLWVVAGLIWAGALINQRRTPDEAEADAAAPVPAPRREFAG
jgi:O-antigen ligase